MSFLTSAFSISVGENTLEQEFKMTKTIYLAGGCFWGMQKYFDQFEGIVGTEVCADSGHAETLRIVYDPALVSLRKLLDDYFLVIDPVSVNRQGGDSGIQYRTGIYYTDPEDLGTIRDRAEEEARKLGAPLAVEILPLENFYPAEEYHQKYLEKNPGGYCHIPAKMFTLAKKGKES